jgi:DNA-binding NarL/FixJ family response regulator
MQGRIAPAAAAIRRALDAAGDRATRGRLLPALVEILLAAGDIGAARVAADELSELAAELDAPLLDALAKHANGAVQLGEGDPRSALAALREAWTAWQRLGVPYEAARSRVLSARACRRLGDAETAELELAAACSVFEALGAAPDLADARALSSTTQPPGGLTARELEVLCLVATGRTNRSIAAELVLSEKTVARHVSNIFAKLDLSSRTAAAAYAYEHDLI